MATRYGVYIRSDKCINDIIEACCTLLQNTKSKGKIVTARNDAAHGGVKVYLNKDSVVQELLNKKFLFQNGEDLSTIHSLVTHVTVHDAAEYTTEEETFIQDLRSTIGKLLGPVLDVRKIPISKQHPDIWNGNFHVILDVPEVVDLDVFKRNGLQDKLEVKVPGIDKKLAVTFRCALCDEDGHTRWQCSTLKSSSTSVDETSPCPQSSIKEETSVSEPTSGFYIRDLGDNDRDFSPEARPSLKRKRITEFEREIGKEEALSYYNSCPLPHSVKNEIDLVEVNSSNSEDEKDSEISHNADESILSGTCTKASSTTNDGGIKAGPASSPMKTPRKNQSTLDGYLFFNRNSIDDFVTTSNQPAAATDTIKSEPPSTDECDSDSRQGQSSTTHARVVRNRKKPAQNVPIVIPDRIKSIIGRIESKPVDAPKLEAFLNHVKKKSKPYEIAKFYTPNVTGMKHFLQQISDQYYLTPDRGTNAEIQFMKWFANVLGRFDGTPSTRRRATKRPRLSGQDQ
ncbi:uncharacterized protein CDAR_189211 [Caerostris darwini]|uniref:Uncharacterized protein n=1 Tax=Caerostris darwini TaxID=1538125 RepID=A0AAV4SPP1_9ARAC|nr:uncharacterized protein CDAR_189211 [Caerostris darwini]